MPVHFHTPVHVDRGFEHELRLSQKHVLRLAIPDSPELGLIIVSPLTDTSSDLSGPSLSRTVGTDSPNRSRRPSNEADEGPPSPPRKCSHARIASDLSKKLKRYSCKWIREKSGRRWVEEDYGTVLQKLRRLK
ncbi:uncharacterized protein B0H18DRAFT_1122357 [Fomitopsis serialis]|uniref:uncharacterized protein n=1 Tax=Fomitopsis serialis TaxID=139415 RepID=UPI002008537F|nr:uncharacterized protein B0H18DRAFT_1122357 [Neoantrodia serialis]KAH9919715.1 hypothetical protein B0H18DRAFT_1122357 [Neoantrodia serialis]